MLLFSQQGDWRMSGELPGQSVVARSERDDCFGIYRDLDPQFHFPTTRHNHL